MQNSEKETINNTFEKAQYPYISDVHKTCKNKERIMVFYCDFNNDTRWHCPAQDKMAKPHLTFEQRKWTFKCYQKIENVKWCKDTEKINL